MSKMFRAILTSALLAPLAALVASLVSIMVIGILAVVAGIPSPMLLFGAFVLKHIDVNTFIHLLLTVPNTKEAGLRYALFGMIAIGTVLGWLYAALAMVRLPASGYRPGRREWIVALALIVLMTATGILLFWNELAQNHWGFPIPISRLLTSLGLLLDFAAYGVALCLCYRALLPKVRQAEVPVQNQRRRQLLSGVGVATLGLGATGASYGLIQEYLKNYTSYDGTKTAWHNERKPPVSPITPNDEHYVVTQNPVDPQVDASVWRLEVTGLVNKGGTYTLDELRQLPSVSRPITLECIANGIGDHLIGTAIWQGVTLRTLLDRHAGAQENATHVTFYSVDGYNISLPLKEVLEADAMLAWNMNGVDIPPRHGYPLRVLIPGRYGEEQPKWLTRVELTNHFVGGLYSDQGWYNGMVHTISRIDYPQTENLLPVGQQIEVGGIAFAGFRGIQKVEVSTNGGITWQAAQLKPALSKDSWVFWAYQWRPTKSGNYKITARATDGTSSTQNSEKQGTVPNGATGYHQITVIVQ
jgi:DMSO/TMAO reductase YedYZ molybdopterin-dependent catalytic subunit